MKNLSCHTVICELLSPYLIRVWWIQMGKMSKLGSLV
jgi:hypothetical protein